MNLSNLTKKEKITEIFEISILLITSRKRLEEALINQINLDYLKKCTKYGYCNKIHEKTVIILSEPFLFDEVFRAPFVGLKVSFEADFINIEKGDILISAKVIEKQNQGILLTISDFIEIVIYETFLPLDYKNIIKINDIISVYVLNVDLTIGQSLICILGAFHYYKTFISSANDIYFNKFNFSVGVNRELFDVFTGYFLGPLPEITNKNLIQTPKFKINEKLEIDNEMIGFIDNIPEYYDFSKTNINDLDLCLFEILNVFTMSLSNTKSDKNVGVSKLEKEEKTIKFYIETINKKFTKSEHLISYPSVKKLKLTKKFTMKILKFEKDNKNYFKDIILNIFSPEAINSLETIIFTIDYTEIFIPLFLDFIVLIGLFFDSMNIYKPKAQLRTETILYVIIDGKRDNHKLIKRKKGRKKKEDIDKEEEKMVTSDQNFLDIQNKIFKQVEKKGFKSNGALIEFFKENFEILKINFENYIKTKIVYDIESLKRETEFLTNLKIQNKELYKFLTKTWNNKETKDLLQSIFE